jgi:cytochrome P450
MRSAERLRETARAIVPILRRPRAGWHEAPRPPFDNPLFGHIPPLDGSRLDYLARAARQYGDVVRLEFPLVTAHLLAHPDHVQRVLVEQQKIFTKQTRGYDSLRLFLGNGLVTSEGDFWLRQRRIAQPAFQKKKIDAFAPAMVRATRELAADWERAAKGRAVLDIADEMMRLTLRIAGETLLSTDPSQDSRAIADALGVVQEEANIRINRPFASLPVQVPTARNRRFLKAANQLDEIVRRIIQARRTGAERKDDLLQTLLESRDDVSGETMSDQQLRDEVMTIFLAGHETTSNTLAWTFYLLGKSPSIARALSEEAASVLGDRDATAADCARLDLTKRVIFEAMRLYPPAWIIGRAPSEDVQFDGYDMPAWSPVFLSPWVTHRHPAFWDDPEGFDPDRWLPARMANAHKYRYFPFAAGPRMCIGSGFATMEAQLVLATLARRFRVSLLPGQSITPEPLVTLRPHGGLKATVHRIG